ncbi:MAG TPA: hypothetical protein VIB47_07140 [Dehalococcoidia bacterium]|jgi:hypothetical protein
MTTKYAPSDTVAGRLYRVEIQAGEGVCDCRGYRSWGHCKHVDRALAEEKESNAMTTKATEENASFPGRTDDRALVQHDGRPPEAVAVSPPARVLPTIEELGIMGKIATSLVNARGHAIPTAIDSPSKAAAVMLAGWELGLRPMTAFRHIFVVNGRTAPDAQVMMGLVQAKDPGAQFVFHTYTHDACKVELRRSGRAPVVVEYTKADARQSGQLAKEGPWQQYTRDMLAWSAVKRACRLGAADLINAIPSIDVGDMGDVIEATATELPEPSPQEVQAALLDPSTEGRGDPAQLTEQELANEGIGANGGEQG